MSRYASAVREELWSRGGLVERRLSHGEAVQSNGITASDVRDDALVGWCDAEIAKLRAAATRAPLVRLVADASTDGNASIIVASWDGLSIVTDPANVDRDLALLESRIALRRTTVDSHGADTILWRNGSAAVLLHEAFGHPLEHGHAALDWPSWLSIEAPLAHRRASFRDVPLLRMTTLTACQQDAPWDVPRTRIEVHLVDGGAYEPLTGVVSLHIASADLVDGDDVAALGPFEIQETREAIASALTGATGEPVRYPGVICSREGQEVVVGSYAPVMITRFR